MSTKRREGAKARWRYLLVAVLSACSSPPPPESAAPAEDTLVASDGSTLTGTAPRATGGFASVVILHRESPEEYPVPSEPAVMDQYNTEFHPPVLLARVGQKVQFKNSEDTLHNVHVIDVETRDTAFNVATPVTGAYEHVFDAPAVYDVSCGIHPSMAAFVVVTDSPFAAVADTDGTFSLADVPPGAYTVTVWNLDPSRRSEHEVVVDEATTTLPLDGVS